MGKSKGKKGKVGGEVKRLRRGKRPGSGGKSDTRLYPRHGDATDQKLRSLRQIIMAPSREWGKDAAGKVVKSER